MQSGTPRALEMGVALPSQMRVNLAELPVDHPLRNTPMERIESLLARNVIGGVGKDPRTWRVAKARYNDLTSAWEFTEWTAEDTLLAPSPACILRE